MATQKEINDKVLQMEATQSEHNRRLDKIEDNEKVLFSKHDKNNTTLSRVETLTVRNNEELTEIKKSNKAHLYWLLGVATTIIIFILGTR